MNIQLKKQRLGTALVATALAVMAGCNMMGRDKEGEEHGGTRGPAFIVFKNFDAIHSYNASESYALAIAHLADRLRGAGPLQASWPTDDPILSRTERRELQEKLIERGFLAGDADGIVGSRTVAAVKAFQTSAGLPSDGYASASVLKALKETGAPK